MEYAIGALIPVLLFICFYAGYKIGQRSRRPVHREVDEETVRKAKELKKGFADLMSYDVHKALGRKG